MVGILLSFWEGLFSGAMLVSGRVMVNWWFGLVVWISGIPYERDCYLGAPLESQTTNPNHSLTISWFKELDRGVHTRMFWIPNVFVIECLLLHWKVFLQTNLLRTYCIKILIWIWNNWKYPNKRWFVQSDIYLVHPHQPTRRIRLWNPHQ